MPSIEMVMFGMVYDVYGIGFTHIIAMYTEL